MTQSSSQQTPATPGVQSTSLVGVSIDRAIMRLAVPSIGGLIFTMLFNLVDAFFVGRLGPAALAAVSTSAFLYWALESVAEIPTIGGRSRAAHCVGAGDAEGARREASAALVLGFILGAFAMFLGLWGLDAIFDFMGVDDVVREHGRAYLSMLFLGAHGLVYMRVSEGLLQAAGDARTPMLIHVGALLLNVILDPLLIFGVGPFPEMGVMGAGVATAGCQGVGAIVSLWVLHRRGFWSRASLAGSLAVPTSLLSVLRIGLPVGALSIVFCFVYVALTRVVSQFGTPALAALGLGHRIESIDYFLAVGFAATVGSLVGQSLGAGRPDRAHEIVTRTLRIASVPVLLISGLMIAAPTMLAGAFVDDAETVRLAGRYIRIVGFCHLPMVWWIIIQGAFGGAGRTLGPMALVLPVVMARLPLAWWMTQRRGASVEVVWWIISLTAALNGTLMVWWWFREMRPRAQNYRSPSRPAA